MKPITFSIDSWHIKAFKLISTVRQQNNLLSGNYYLSDYLKDWVIICVSYSLALLLLGTLLVSIGAAVDRIYTGITPIDLWSWAHAFTGIVTIALVILILVALTKIEGPKIRIVYGEQGQERKDGAVDGRLHRDQG